MDTIWLNFNLNTYIFIKKKNVFETVIINTSAILFWPLCVNSMRPIDAYICIAIGDPTIIGSDNGLLPGWRQAIICFDIVYWTLRNKFQWNSNQNASIFIQESAFEYAVCKMVIILSQSQCV